MTIRFWRWEIVIRRQTRFVPARLILAILEEDIKEIWRRQPVRILTITEVGGVEVGRVVREIEGVW